MAMHRGNPHKGKGKKKVKNVERRWAENNAWTQKTHDEKEKRYEERKRFKNERWFF